MNGRRNSQSSCFGMCFTRRRAEPVSVKQSISQYMQAVYHLTPAECKAELFHLDDNEARLLKHLYKLGLRGSDIYKARSADPVSYDIFLKQFLFPENSFAHYFHEVFSILLKANLSPHEVFQLLLSFHRQDPESVKHRIDYHVTHHRQTLLEICELYKGKTEEEALNIAGPNHIHYKF